MSFRLCKNRDLKEKESFMTIYNPIAGWKWQILSWVYEEDDCPAHYEPHGTSAWAEKTPKDIAFVAIFEACALEIPLTIPAQFRKEPWYHELKFRAVKLQEEMDKAKEEEYDPSDRGDTEDEIPF